MNEVEAVGYNPTAINDMRNTLQQYAKDMKAIIQDKYVPFKNYLRNNWKGENADQSLFTVSECIGGNYWTCTDNACVADNLLSKVKDTWEAATETDSFGKNVNQKDATNTPVEWSSLGIDNITTDLSRENYKKESYWTIFNLEVDKARTITVSAGKEIQAQLDFLHADLVNTNTLTMSTLRAYVESSDIKENALIGTEQKSALQEFIDALESFNTALNSAIEKFGAILSQDMESIAGVATEAASAIKDSIDRTGTSNTTQG